MPFDLKAALDKVPADKRKAVEDALKESTEFILHLDAVADEASTAKARVTEVEGNLKTIEDRWKLANDEFSKLVDDQDATQKERDDARAKLAAAETAKTEAQARLAQALETQPKVDLSKYLTAEQIENQRRTDAANQTAYFTEALDVMDEIRAVTGKGVKSGELIKNAMAAKQTPREYAEATYKLQEIRDTKAKEQRDKEIKEATDAGYAKALADSRNPATRTLGDSEDPFYTPKAEAKDGPKQPWDENPDVTPKDEQDLLRELHGMIQ